MSTVRVTNAQIRKNKGRVDRAKVRKATEEQIAAWKREEGFANYRVSDAARLVPAVDVRKVREDLGLTQEQFAATFLLSLRTIQEWEQDRKEPSEAARVLLYAIARDPRALARALSSDLTDVKKRVKR